MKAVWSHMPFDDILPLLTNLKHLEIRTSSAFLSHDGLLPLVGRPNFTLDIWNCEITNISLDGFQKMIQVR